MKMPVRHLYDKAFISLKMPYFLLRYFHESEKLKSVPGIRTHRLTLTCRRSGNALLRRLVRIGVLEESKMKLDFVLGLKVEDFLERRLQTQVFKLGLAKSIHHARVLIRQRHIRYGPGGEWEGPRPPQWPGLATGPGPGGRGRPQPAVLSRGANQAAAIPNAGHSLSSVMLCDLCHCTVWL